MHNHRFMVLDGWRGIAIILVLLAHLFPMGPKVLQLNAAIGISGMAIFFCLSGFLMTHFLLERPNITDFIIRRLFRILPLAWLYLTVVFSFFAVSNSAWLAHVLFYANYPPKPLFTQTDHLWSLCVELHYYLGIGLLVAALPKKAFVMLPILCLIFTAIKIQSGLGHSVITHLRIDEILIGGVLAQIYNDKLISINFSKAMKSFISGINLPLIGAAFLISCHTESYVVQYLRPYLIALIIGASLFNPVKNQQLIRLLSNKYLAYMATISFAVYIIHPLLLSTWLGSGNQIEKYAKRPLLLIILFALAHLSTFHYEKRWIAFGKTVSNYLAKKKKADLPIA